MHYLKAKLARLFSSARSGPRQPRTPLRKKALAAVVPAALVAGLVLAPSASATWGTPPATEVEAVSESTKFIPENAYGALFLKCLSSTANATTPAGPAEPEEDMPPNHNMNRGPAVYGPGPPAPVGAHSMGPGGVYMETTEPPKFEECGVYQFTESGEEVLVVGATTATNNTNGNWSISGYAVNQLMGGEPQPEEVSIAAIGVPKGGAVITAFVGTENECTITVAPQSTVAVTADYVNGAAQELQVDSQVPFEGQAGTLCAVLPSPAQFEGDYAVTPNLEINR